MFPELEIAAIIPCHNEAAAVGKVITDLRSAVPQLRIYVYDNLSTDGTAAVARDHGATVRTELRKGKGNVVRRAFGDIDADVYVLIDGDDTYDAHALPQMIQALLDGPFDHVLGVRQEQSDSAYRPGHSLGNRAFNSLVSWLFKEPVSDMLSGYRVFSKRFVKSFPAVSREFETETELTVHYASLRIPHTEVEVGFKDRAEGTESKLNTVSDGIKILSLIVDLVRFERPLVFHGTLALIALVAALCFGVPVLVDFAQTGLVPKFPSAILASSLAIVGFMSLSIGMTLDGIRRNRHENARLLYLQYPAVGSGKEF
ncbi:glycosyltransferase [Pseudoclavibacter sp. 13-3]|uniref:glycosyltransferase n=1 Tax=Pseudoclavibacter sp. 13-3 TaxID=2901228 RepID=UPI001E2A2CE7|nr:glycosyltransferase [Pseudoclavibacter sp. 13-3]MCD7101233.1 glycosyltransferase [Pseudoclavibacter sp. 13-3]